MRKRNAFIGKPIVAYDTGDQIGKVEEVLVDLSHSQVVGFVLSEGNWSSNVRVVLLSHIQAAGPDAIIIPSQTVLTNAEQQPDLAQLLEWEKERRQLKILTNDGRDLGAMLDVYFDEKTGVIQGYETKGGLFSEDSFGRSFVPAPREVQVGTQFIFLPAETAELMTAREVASSDSMSQTSNEPEPGARKFMEAEPLDSSPPRTIEQTKGLRARRTVQTPIGIIIVAQGQIITEAIIEEARKHREEQSLLQAVTLSAEEKASSRVIHFWETTGERVREEVSHVVENTAGLWERVKDTVVDVTKRGAWQQRQQAGTNQGTEGSTSEQSHSVNGDSEKRTPQNETGQTPHP